jgi:flavodoxin
VRPLRPAVTGAMNRRTLLQGSFVLGAGALLGTQLAGCNASGASSSAAPASEVATSQPRDTTERTAAPGSRMLLAYFSRAGENYYYGGRTVLEVGNTAVVAEMISSTVAVDVFRIEAVEPYPDSYDATVERNVREQNSEARPAITGALPAVGTYNTVLLGSGIWNIRPPMIMRTFVENVDLSGKTIFPFVTYAVSGLGSTIDDYTRLCPRSTIGEGLAVRGEQARDARADVRAWLRRTGLLSQ